MEEDIPPTAHAVAEAQRLTGEVMWLAHKTRPDVAFASSLMASITLRAPSRCIAIGHKVLRYLQATKNLRMAIQSDGGDLVLYPDAAFAPNSGRSHTGWTVYWAGTPVSWRSGRQSTIALSTAESELQAILDGAVGSLGLEAMLLVEPATKVIASDSTSALAIGAGTGSWRTRHLRLKSAWIQDMLSSGEIQLKHQPGLSQPADLLTKALSAQRIRALLDLWAVEEPRSGRQPRAFFSSETATKALVGVLYSDDGGRGKPEEPMSATTRTIDVDWDLAAILMGLLMILGGLMFYEGVKWGLFEIYYQYTPGATTRRMRRLRNLRESTSLAIERELERASAIGLYRRDPNDDVTPRTQPSTSESLRRRRVDAQPSHRYDPPASSSSRRDYATPRPSQAPGTPPRRTSIIDILVLRVGSLGAGSVGFEGQNNFLNRAVQFSDIGFQAVVVLAYLCILIAISVPGARPMALSKAFAWTLELAKNDKHTSKPA